MYFSLCMAMYELVVSQNNNNKKTKGLLKPIQTDPHRNRLDHSEVNSTVGTQWVSFGDSLRWGTLCTRPYLHLHCQVLLRRMEDIKLRRDWSILIKLAVYFYLCKQNIFVCTNKKARKMNQRASVSPLYYCLWSLFVCLHCTACL